LGPLADKEGVERGALGREWKKEHCWHVEEKATVDNSESPPTNEQGSAAEASACEFLSGEKIVATVQ